MYRNELFQKRAPAKKIAVIFGEIVIDGADPLAFAFRERSGTHTHVRVWVCLRVCSCVLVLASEREIRERLDRFEAEKCDI